METDVFTDRTYVMLHDYIVRWMEKRLQSDTPYASFQLREHGAAILTKYLGMDTNSGPHVEFTHYIEGPINGGWICHIRNHVPGSLGVKWGRFTVSPDGLKAFRHDLNRRHDPQIFWFIKDQKPHRARTSYFPIDVGLSSVMPYLWAMGCKTHWSCAGHPTGTYINFTPGKHPLPTEKELRAIGWTVVALSDQHRRVNDTPNAIGYRILSDNRGAPSSPLDWATRDYSIDALEKLLKRYLGRSQENVEQLELDMLHSLVAYRAGYRIV